MKKVFVLILLLFQSQLMKSQITPENQFYIYKKDFYVKDIGDLDFKYIISDSLGFSIYNLDFSPYLTNVVSPIQLWKPPSYYQISYVSKDLFDCDTSNIEYVITQWSYPANFYIYRTDGTQLFEKDSVTGYFSIAFPDGEQYLHPVENTPSGTKLFLSDNRSNVLADSVYVFSLCGHLPASIANSVDPSNSTAVFPNPTDGVINFQFNQPNYQDYELTICNSVFQKIDQLQIHSNYYKLDLRQKNIYPGIYFYYLRKDNKVLDHGKFIIIRQ